ncbi:MAG: DUF5103 domain-containing protein [Bacteroidales bacterium]
MNIFYGNNHSWGYFVQFLYLFYANIIVSLCSIEIMIKMKCKILYTFICWITVCTLFSQVNIQTRVLDKRISSLQLRVNDNWRNPPVLKLNSDDYLSVGFDVLSSDISQFYFVVNHCNADWTISHLSDSECLEGFNRVDIQDYESSYNTLIAYTHYTLKFPDELLRPMLSGNYVIRVYDYESDDDMPVLMACFSVTEDRVRASGDVSGITLLDYKEKHQQLKLRINNENFNISNPASDLKIVIQQNSRRDNQKKLSNPLYVDHNEIVYENNKNLIFEAGNQFRRFEMTTHQYAGMGIEQIEYKDECYQVFLYEDEVRADKSYQYEQDQHGRYLVRALNVTDSNTEADYFQTCFKLNYENPFLDGSIYIFGELSDYRFDERFKMQYDPLSKAYKQNVLLKEGLYNYMYIFVPQGKTEGSTALIAGNYYETRNEYLIYVYYRAIGDRYDRLIATTLLY